MGMRDVTILVFGWAFDIGSALDVYLEEIDYDILKALEEMAPKAIEKGLTLDWSENGRAHFGLSLYDTEDNYGEMAISQEEIGQKAEKILHTALNNDHPLANLLSDLIGNCKPGLFITTLVK